MHNSFKNQQILAIIPQFMGGLDGAKVYYEDQSVEDIPMKASRFLSELAKQRGINISYLRKNQGDSRGWTCPLPLNHLQTFVPIKVRKKSEYGRVCTYGYFNYNLRYDAAFHELDDKTTIIDICPRSHCRGEVIPKVGEVQFPVVVQVPLQKVYRSLDRALYIHYSLLWQTLQQMQHISNQHVGYYPMY